MDTSTMIKNLEGYEKKPYPDPLTGGAPFTFGYGFTYITKEESDAVLAIREKDIRNGLVSKYRWFRDLSPLRQSVVINMVYQIGFNGFSKFKNTIEYLKNKEYEKAAKEMLDSSWYRQMHELDMTDGVDEENRAEWLSWMMEYDEYRDRRV